MRRASRDVWLARARVWIARIVLIALCLALGLMLGWAIAAADSSSSARHVPEKPCPTVSCLRRAAAWNHSVVVVLNERIAIANGRAGGGRDLPPCHTLTACKRLNDGQRVVRLRAEAAWSHLQHDETPVGFQRIIRYQFHPCGKTATAHAFTVAHGENRFVINDRPSPTNDYGGWQINYDAHSRAFGPTDASFFHVALDAWRSTQVAVRWSSCGTNFSPTWTAATKAGVP